MTEREPGLGRKSPPNLPSLSAIVEAILFASDRPVSVKALAEAIPEADAEALEGALAELTQRYESEGSGIGLQELADGYQLTTRASLSAYVERFLVGRRRARLSRAALETLATIAYRQPITRGEIEDLRGVDCGQVLHTLLTRELITVKGRSEGLGRPLLYGTTPEFLTYFGLRGMGDLPNMDELQALTDVDPLEDPEIREALEASGLLEGLDAEREDVSALADPESDAVGSSGPAREEELARENGAPDGAKDEDFASEIRARSDEDAEANAPDCEVAEADAAPTDERDPQTDGPSVRARRETGGAGARNGRSLRIVQADGAVPLPENQAELAATEGNGAPH